MKSNRQMTDAELLVELDKLIAEYLPCAAEKLSDAESDEFHCDVARVIEFLTDKYAPKQPSALSQLLTPEVIAGVARAVAGSNAKAAMEDWMNAPPCSHPQTVRSKPMIPSRVKCDPGITMELVQRFYVLEMKDGNHTVRDESSALGVVKGFDMDALLTIKGADGMRSKWFEVVHREHDEYESIMGTKWIVGQECDTAEQKAE